MVYWDPVQDNETHVTHYEVQYWEDRELQPLLMTYSENATINTSADSTYHITVSATSVIGRGAWSNIVTVTVDAREFENAHYNILSCSVTAIRIFQLLLGNSIWVQDR